MRLLHPAFWLGVRGELPILLGVVPFGMIYGASALSAGLSPLQAQAMSAIVFAGSAQFVLTQLIDAGAEPVVMILTVLVVNLRHLLYSASVAPHLQSLSRGWQLILAYLLTDEAYVVAITQFVKESSAIAKGWFLAGAGLALWATWQLSTAAGVFLGQQLPPSIPLDFALSLTFIAIVVPLLRDRAGIMAAVVAGGVMILAVNAPLNLGLVIAALAGMVAGVVFDRAEEEA